MWRGGPDGGEGRRGAEVTGVGAAGAAGDEGRTRGTGIGRGPIRIGARGRRSGVVGGEGAGRRPDPVGGEREEWIEGG